MLFEGIEGGTTKLSDSRITECGVDERNLSPALVLRAYTKRVRGALDSCPYYAVIHSISIEYEDISEKADSLIRSEDPGDRS